METIQKCFLYVGLLCSLVGVDLMLTTEDGRHTEHIWWDVPLICLGLIYVWSRYRNTHYNTDTRVRGIHTGGRGR